jgi:hypothetical protein
MTTTKKCEHTACNCMVEPGKSHCSDTCADAKKTPELTCQCNHPKCSDIGLKMWRVLEGE